MVAAVAAVPQARFARALSFLGVANRFALKLTDQLVILLRSALLVCLDLPVCLEKKDTTATRS